jgi:hypothetical protein
VPEVNNFDQVPGFVKPVVNSHWRVENRANILAPRTRHAQMRKSSEALHVTQQRVAEARSSVRLVQANELEDLEKIFPCAGRDNNFVHPLPGATPLKLSSEIRKGNTLTRIQLSQALIHSRKCCRIRVVDDLGYRMIKLQLSHTSTMLAAARAEPHSLPTGTEVSVSAVSLSISLPLPNNRNADVRPAQKTEIPPSPWYDKNSGSKTHEVAERGGIAFPLFFFLFPRSFTRASVWGRLVACAAVGNRRHFYTAY